ncbi:MAG: UDP-N-acetylmuramoyl-tripeptide--D-alanyl-D-alanine ligase [Alistipes sp.]|nr:UDP-N-acetylmuramoyl-tripeptide--D-alanyl-D-alanine ligase [Candidatus Minthomonas equi]
MQEKLVVSTGVTTDSRKVRPGEMFFALKGERFDGNEFAEAVVEAGALCAVVDRESAVGEKVYCGELDSERFIVVDDSLAAMQKLATWHRMRFDIPVIGLTGTNGKTTTKELVNAVLSTKFRTVATMGNLNNHIGVPLTLFRIDDDTQCAVIEMGASHPGEIALLAEIARPTHGLITNVGKAHLEGFGSFKGVCRTKGELYDFLWKSGGTAFYNVDNPYLREMTQQRVGMVTVKYGKELDGWRVSRTDARHPYLSVYNGWKRIHTQLVGGYNVDNVLAALCVGVRMGIPFSTAARAIAGYSPSNSRSQLKDTGRNILILDTYNANPTSMRTSVENFAGTVFKHKVLILGDMLELGAESAAEHRAIVELASGIGAEQVYFVGTEFSGCRDAVNGQDNVSFFSSAEELASYIKKGHPFSGMTIFIKGSNGMRLSSLEQLF